MCQQNDIPADLPPDPPLPPRLVVGLGNPGVGYHGNRHNIGFMVLDELAARLGRTFNGAEKVYQVAAPGPKSGEEPGDGSCDGSCDGPGDLVLLKPLTFMNLSGEAVMAWLEKAGQTPCPERILVVCDDLALPLGTIRLRAKGSSGGQNGLASILEHLETEGIARLRLGVDGTEGELRPEDWPDYVLSDFAPEEQALARALVKAGAEAVLGWAADGVERTASRRNGPVRLLEEE